MISPPPQCRSALSVCLTDLRDMEKERKNDETKRVGRMIHKCAVMMAAIRTVCSRGRVLLGKECEVSVSGPQRCTIINRQGLKINCSLRINLASPSSSAPKSALISRTVTVNGSSTRTHSSRCPRGMRAGTGRRREGWGADSDKYRGRQRRNCETGKITLLIRLI